MMTPTRAALAPALAVLALTAAIVSLPARAQAPADPLPEGPGKALVASACTVCHQIEVVTAQRHTAAEWDEVIGKMIDRGATLTDAEQDQVQDYLAKNFGVGGTAAPATPPAEAAPPPPPTPPEPPKGG
jgi:hypothetical protein